jgi:hypothetical protein
MRLKDEAVTTAYRWRTVLELAFARRNIQADFGDRAPRGSFFFPAGIRMLEGSYRRLDNCPSHCAHHCASDSLKYEEGK